MARNQKTSASRPRSCPAEARLGLAGDAGMTGQKRGTGGFTDKTGAAGRERRGCHSRAERDSQLLPQPGTTGATAGASAATAGGQHRADPVQGCGLGRFVGAGTPLHQLALGLHGHQSVTPCRPPSWASGPSLSGRLAVPVRASASPSICWCDAAGVMSTVFRSPWATPCASGVRSTAAQDRARPPSKPDFGQHAIAAKR